jgi:hypothetical protein
MRRLSLLVLFVAATALARGSRPVPELSKPPKLDGNLKELAKGAAFSAPGGAIVGHAAVHHGTLFVGLEVPAGEAPVQLSLHFPEAGVGAPGYTYLLGKAGAVDMEGLAPEFAQKLVRTAEGTHADKRTFEVAIPLIAFPRFPAKGPLTAELCITAEKTTSCDNGSMAEPLKLPDAMRRDLKAKFPPNVVSVEPADGGWLGYGELFYPRWVQADEEITRDVLHRLLPNEQIEAESAHVNVPPELDLPSGGKIFSVLSGQDPYVKPGQCDADKELRLGLFLVQGKMAERVLDRPAATCALGRASSVVLDEKGTLTIGYSNGGTSTFVWTKDHFERTEIG